MRRPSVPDPSPAPERSPGARGAQAILLLSGVSLGLLVAVAVAVTVAGTAAACTSLAGCLTDGEGALALVHVAGAGVLLIVVIALTAVAGVRRRDVPGAWAPAGAALAVLLVAAGFGMAFASGGLPDAYAPVQFGLLTATALLLVVVARRAYGILRRRIPGRGLDRDAPP
ncbi:MAG: hypothetical protein QXG65_01765 [Thermoplasmata archaeon]